MTDLDWKAATEAVKTANPGSFDIEIPATEWDDEVRIIVKRPPAMEWKRVRAMMTDDAQRADALQVLSTSCVIYPDRDGFSKLLSERPALAETIGNKLCELAGLVKGATVKKS